MRRDKKRQPRGTRTRGSDGAARRNRDTAAEEGFQPPARKKSLDRGVRNRVRAVFVVYALSGFVSLGYQVAWFRIMTDWFGSTNLTFTLVVCNFIGGLGVGSLLSRRLSDLLAARLGTSDRLRVYGIVELLVAFSASLTVVAGFLPKDVWGTFPYQLSDGIWMPSLAYSLSETGVAAVCVFIPCFFMGVTYPLLCHAFLPQDEGRFPAALYAWNTLGACAGVLVCQFLLILKLGHGLTFQIMIGLNLALGLYFLFRGGAPVEPAAPREPVAWTGRSGVGVLLFCAVIGGLLSGALEGDLFKRLSFAVDQAPGATMSFISFWAIAGIFLASTLVNFFLKLRLWHIKVGFFLALAYCAVVWQNVNTILDTIQRPLLDGDFLVIFPANLFQLFCFAGLFTLVPYFMVSLLLPYVCNRLQGEQKHLGLAYGLNTLAFSVGMIGFTLIAPRVNIFFSLKIFFVLMGLLAALLALLVEGRRLALWKPAVFVAAFVAAVLLVPRSFDPSYFRPRAHPTRYPVRALMSNGANTTFVVQLPGEPKLFFGRMTMSGTNLRAQTYMRLMAHVPLLMHPDPEKALLICFGVGNTASAIACHDRLRQIDVVDLNENIFVTAPEFSKFNRNVHQDPRVRLICDDGRKFLQVTDETYDLVTSEPPPPLSAGVYRLYSKEYYEGVLAHLTERGMMTQWLPVYQMSSSAIDAVIQTFVDVFSHTMLFSGHDTELILLGSRAPIEPDRLSNAFPESGPVAYDLRLIGVRRPADLTGRILETDERLRRQYQGHRVISDQHNDLEQTFMNISDLERIQSWRQRIPAVH